jgi:hypothetical protein
VKPTATRVRELLSYDPETGVFRWLKTSRAIKAGDVAGSDNGKGYLQISIDGTKCAASHLAWLYVTGRWPSPEIDHEDTNRKNNAFRNLKEASRSEQCRNVQTIKNSATGLLGVTRRGSRFIAQISVGPRGSRKEHHLGMFDTAQAAHEAYMRAKKTYHATANQPLSE